MSLVLRDWFGDGNYVSEASFVEPLGLQVYGPDWEFHRRVSGQGSSDYICANARLIAASPDLYEAAKAALAHVKDRKTRRKLRDAIAKVETCAPLTNESKPATKSARRPTLDHGTDGQAT